MSSTRVFALPVSAEIETAPFDTIAADYDGSESHNAIWQWMRSRVHQAALAAFRNGNHILEVGSGTGTDALFLARNGYRVVATDPSSAMLAVTRGKLAAAGCADKVEFVQAGAERLETLPARGKFDGIFSNFGALNCVADLRGFSHSAARLLHDEGRMLLCLMPPICPWEIVYYLARGKSASAFRRWRGRWENGGIPVHVGGRNVQTYYYSRRTIARAFREKFEIEKQFALGVMVPPPYLHAVTRYEKLFEALRSCEELTAGWPMLRTLGDHVVVILKRRT